MRASVRILLVVAVLVVAAIGWAQPRERTGEVSPDKAAAVKAATKNIEGAKGTVLLLGLQNSFLMKTSDGYLIAHHGPEFFDLGIMRGDEVAVWGVQRPVEKNPFNNEIDASKVELVKRAENRPEPLGIHSIADVQAMRFADRVVLTYGTVEELSRSNLRLSQGGSTIRVQLPSVDLTETYAYSVGVEILVLGELKIKPTGKELVAIAVRPKSVLDRPDEPKETQEISQVNKDRPIGKMVRIRGYLAVYIGDEDATIVYKGQDFIVAYRSARFLSLDLPAGKEVEAVGIYGVETHNDKEVGVIREARITESLLLKQADKATQSSP